MKISKVALAACALAISGSAAFATPVTFENESPLALDPTNVGTSYVNKGITFTSTENMQLVGVGAPASGFVPDDLPVGASFGEVFLTGDFDGNTDMTLSFAHQQSSVSFDIADIDGGSSDAVLEDNDEIFTITYLLNSVVQYFETVTANDVAGNGTVTSFFYDGKFDEITISGVTDTGARNIGWGIDNIAAVPVPAALPLLGTGFAALGFLGWRRKRTAA